MTTIDEIKRLMEELDERKDEMSDGDYLNESNKLLENYKQLKELSSPVKNTIAIISATALFLFTATIIHSIRIEIRTGK